MAAVNNLSDYLSVLERNGELCRVKAEVDPVLEITEIATRAVREGGPALLFERVKGSGTPLVINLMASMRRSELGLGRHPEQIGEELHRMADQLLPPTPRAAWRNRGGLRRMLHMLPNRVRRAPVRRGARRDPDLAELPILQCWPGDAGRFLTLPLVITHRPGRPQPNMGMYRMQVYDEASTGMHFQLQKGGGFHLLEAQRRSEPLPVAVALSGDPALILAAVMALPEGVDEMSFAGLLRGGRTKYTRGSSVPFKVPAEAEFVLEGWIDPSETRLEGPFGDHFGHYSTQEQFPIFRISTLWRRRGAIYPATVVGKPPMEDRFIGDASQLVLGPLIKLFQPEISDMWAYHEAGFHNLLVAALDQRYRRNGLKAAFGILGQGQLSLTKTIVLVDSDVNPRDPRAVLAAFARNFSPASGFTPLALTALDTLDFTSGTLHMGSKMVLDATSDQVRPPEGRGGPPDLAVLERCRPRISGHRLLMDAVLMVRTTAEHGAKLVEELVNLPQLSSLKLVVAVSPDVDLESATELIWGTFTRFDCMRDVRFSSTGFEGAEPRYGGVMGIDATHKPGYPAAIEMDPRIVKLVDDRWSEYNIK